MSAPRAALRTTRLLRLRQPTVRQAIRHNSTSAKPQDPTTQAVLGGIAGGSLILLVGYGYYQMSGLKTLVQATKQAKSTIDTATQKLKESAPEPNEALNWLRQTAGWYASFIPGGKQYVNSAFDDLDLIRQKHGKEVDDIVRQAYDELKDVGQSSGMSIETLQKAWGILQKHLGHITELAGDSAQEILDRHPQLKEKVGGNWDRLKEMGDQYGPQAKEEVEKTWAEVRDILKDGMTFQTVTRIQRLLQDKTEKIKRLGDEAWKKGMEEMKPYLEKNPKAKELIEKNADALKRGDISTLFEKVKQGDAGDLEEYVNQAVEKGKQTGKSYGLDQYLSAVPGWDEVGPKISQLSEVAQKHGKEGEKLAKETFEEIKQVLQKKLKDAEGLADKAKRDAK